MILWLVIHSIPSSLSSVSPIESYTQLWLSSRSFSSLLSWEVTPPVPPYAHELGCDTSSHSLCSVRVSQLLKLSQKRWCSDTLRKLHLWYNIQECISLCLSKSSLKCRICSAPEFGSVAAAQIVSIHLSMERLQWTGSYSQTVVQLHIVLCMFICFLFSVLIFHRT